MDDAAPGLETKSPALATVGQFFLIPLGIVAVCVSLYFLVSFLVGHEEASPEQWLKMIRESGRHGRGYAANMLAAALQKNAEAAGRPGLAAQILDTYDQVSRDGILQGEELVSTQYQLMMCVGMTRDPAAVSRVSDELQSAKDDLVKIACMNVLGAIGDPKGGNALASFLDDAPPTLRKYAVFNLAALKDSSRVEAIKAKLGPDESVDVQWNAAIGLAIFHRDASGLEVIRQMLDLSYMKQFVGVGLDPTYRTLYMADEKEKTNSAQGIRNLSHSMAMACVAAATLKEHSLEEPLRRLGQDEGAPVEVRSAAVAALREMGAN